MRKRRKTKSKTKHQKHEKLAMFAFLVTLLIAIGALYYMWQMSAQYGKSIQGLEAYAKVQWERDNPGVPYPGMVIRQTTTEPCCCETKGGRPLETYVTTGTSDTEEQRQGACLKLCSDKYLAIGMGIGRCGAYGLKYE